MDLGESKIFLSYSKLGNKWSLSYIRDIQLKVMIPVIFVNRNTALIHSLYIAKKYY